MKTKLLIPVFVLAVFSCFIASAQIPKWKLDVGEQIKDYSFLKDGKFLFLTNYEYSWLFNSETGEKVYELREKEFEKTGVHQLVGEKYLIGTDNDLKCYEALTGNLVWKQEYAKVSQDEFSDLDWLGNTLVVRYGKIHLGIDLSTGEELWRTNIEYNGDISKKGGWNYKKLEKQNLLIALMDDDLLGLFQFSYGKKVFEGKEYEIRDELVEKSRRYFYVSPDERYLVFLLDKQMAVVDAVEKKELIRIPMKYDTDYETIIETSKGCVVLGKENLVFVNDSTGATAEVKAAVSDFRTYEVMKVGDNDIFFAGLEDGMFAIDLNAGKVLWQTKEKDPKFEGYAHRYLKIDGNSLLMTYTNGGTQGTPFCLMSIDVTTGNINYQTPTIFMSRIYTPGILRSIGKFLLGTVAGQKHSFGYENIGFDYTITEFEGNLVFSTVSKAMIIHPETKDEGGEGIVIVDPKTGQIIFKDYVQLTDYSYSAQATNEAPVFNPMIDKNMAVLLGDEAIAVYDLSAKNRMLFSKETLKGVPADATIVDNILYIKFGSYKFDVKLDPPDGIFGYLGMKIDKRWDEDPYGFAAYDITSGKQLWWIETKVDPGFLTPMFSLKNNYDSSSKRLYFADEENIYALQMKPDGGRFDYTFNLDKNGLGEMPMKETFAIQEWPIGSKSTTTTYGYGYSITTTTTSIGGAEYDKYVSNLEEADAACQYKGFGNTIWGAVAKKCLRAVYAGSHIFTIGQDALSLINAADGTVIWKHVWEYDPKGIQYLPKIFNGKLVYCLDRKLTCVDLVNGETLWQNKEAKRPIFFNAPNEKYLYVIDEEEIRGYELEKQK